MALPPSLEAQLAELSDEARQLASKLCGAGQEHLFQADASLEDLQRLLAQALHLDASYPGGFVRYVENGRRLLAMSKVGANPFDGYTPAVPTGLTLDYGSPDFEELEALGLEEASKTVFVLVAGGLGERLGYSGIKVALPSSIVSGWCYLELYCRSISALETTPGQIPLVLMTSGDTHDRTLALLEAGAYFGLLPTQVHLMKQEKVPCLANNEAHIAVEPTDRFQIQTKPHGHGDVHSLLYSTGLAKRFNSEGKKWVFFFQDTNGLLFKAAALAGLGSSRRLDLEVNSLSVPRKAKDAMGAITLLKHTDGSSMTLNVEYNQLDPLLRATTSPDGDVNDETGHSPFPGNINQLVFALEPYCATLERTRGTIAEFVNPKYADASMETFKSSTRLECMMQDYPKELPASAKVGFTSLPVWIAYSPVKNNAADAAKKAAGGNHPQSGVTGETDLFAANSNILKMLGAEVGGPEKRTFNGIEVDVYPRVVWASSWARTLAEARQHVGKVKISASSTLLLEGNVHLEDLELDGALIVRAAPGCRVVLRGLKVQNAGWALCEAAAGADEVVRLRGFDLDRRACEERCFSEPGEHVVTA